MQPRNGRRLVWVNGQPHIPFENYRRQPAPADHDDAAAAAHYPVSPYGPQHGLTPTQVWLADERDASAQRERGQLKGPWLNGRKAGIISAVRGERVGNRTWGIRMLARQGGLAMARHGHHILRANARKAGLASGAARRLRKRRESYERALEQQRRVAWRP